MRNGRFDGIPRALAAHVRAVRVHWMRLRPRWTAAAHRHANLVVGFVLAIGILLMVLHWSASAPSTVEAARAQRAQHGDRPEREVARRVARELAVTPELKASVHGRRGDPRRTP